MLTEIRLKNFKCFKDETIFPLGKINLLTGVNGRGKSTMLQAMLLFRQSIEHNPDSTLLILNGSCVQLGSFDEVKNSETPNETRIEIGFTSTALAQDTVVFSLRIPITFVPNNERSLIPTSLEITSNIEFTLSEGGNERIEPTQKYTFGFATPAFDRAYWKLQNNASYRTQAKNFLPTTVLNYVSEGKSRTQYIPDIIPINRIHYIAADRIGPKVSYEQNNIDSFINTGAKGENTATALLLLQNKIVDKKLYLGNDAETLITQTQEWLNYIFDGAKIDIESPYNDIINIFYNTNQKSHRYRGANVGFGYSYILPIIVSGLIANKGEILIVENPEAHLHPKAQNRLTKFLAHVATCGVQVFIESHSEHILNALRIVVLHEDFEIQNQEVSVLYFQDSDDKPFVQLKIESDGKIKNWPDGFFDQQEQDLAEIFKLGRNKK